MQRFSGEYEGVAARDFAMKLTARSLKSQTSYAKDVGKKIQDEQLRNAFLDRIAALEREVDKTWGRVETVGQNYGIVIKRSKIAI